MSSREYRFIVRFMGTDLDGSKKVPFGLSKIRGVGPNFAHAIVKVAHVNPDTRIGSLSEAEMGRIEDVIKDPLKHGIPTLYYNTPKNEIYTIYILDVVPIPTASANPVTEFII